MIDERAIALVIVQSFDIKKRLCGFLKYNNLYNHCQNLHFIFLLKVPISDIKKNTSICKSF